MSATLARPVKVEGVTLVSDGQEIGELRGSSPAAPGRCQAKEAEALSEGVAVNPKEPGGLELIPSRGLQDEGQERALHAVHHPSVELVLIPGEEIPHKAGESLGHDLVEADNAALQSAPFPTTTPPMAVTASRDGR